MGLDMSLYRKMDILSEEFNLAFKKNRNLPMFQQIQYADVKPDEAFISEKRFKALLDNGNTDSNVQILSVPIRYWRKANAIHNWFVENIANGVDECQEIYVTIEDLHNLDDVILDTLRHIITFEIKNPLQGQDKTLDLSGNSDDILPILHDLQEKHKNDPDGYNSQYEITVDDDNNLIPPVSGFFFGDADPTNVWYIYELIETHDFLQEEFDKISGIDMPISYIYQASW